jgi:hypothetical protein
LTSATLTNSALSVSVTGAGSGTATCDGSDTPFTTPIAGTIAAGGDLGPVALVCHYSNMADGAVITATVTIKYTLNALERSASGSPATISFTVQSD